VTNIQNSKHLRGFENCNLKSGAYLEFGAWNLEFSKLCDYFGTIFFLKD
jgi:hypothetical protein